MELKYKRTCFKLRYDSRKEAKKALRDLNQHAKGLTSSLKDVYFCKECLVWHITSAPKSTRDFYRNNFKH